MVQAFAIYSRLSGKNARSVRQPMAILCLALVIFFAGAVLGELCLKCSREFIAGVPFI